MSLTFKKLKGQARNEMNDTAMGISLGSLETFHSAEELALEEG